MIRARVSSPLCARLQALQVATWLAAPRWAGAQGWPHKPVHQRSQAANKLQKLSFSMHVLLCTLYACSHRVQKCRSKQAADRDVFTASTDLSTFTLTAQTISEVGSRPQPPALQHHARIGPGTLAAGTISKRACSAKASLVQPSLGAPSCMLRQVAHKSRCFLSLALF